MNHSMAVTASTLRVPDAELYYEVRGTGPLVVLAGAPMDARSFAPLADLLATGYTVLTTDPRGVSRSPVDDPDRDSTPELRAGDLARLIEHLDAGPATALGSSGGAVSVLALARTHPDRVGTVSHTSRPCSGWSTTPTS
jgi:pimeloyl-ACP methyl ester carboxylesterase